ncbi:MAG TPA: DUF3037 domain-containing protein [Thermoanaerobaculia bacterium]|nr:DUF3037 domain-containing protein [Thermoanaerobaculia bacterium]
MKIPYTFTVLRYVHDAVSGEFVNVGVILYSPSTRFLGAACTRSSQRLSRFFGRIEGDYIKSLLRHIEDGLQHQQQEIFGTLELHPLPEDARACGERVLPLDDSALQMSPVSGGLAEDPKAALDRLFERYVERYSKSMVRSTRHDEEILPLFKKPLEERALLPRMQAKVISTPDYEHEFPLAWKNGVWNACDAVSLDLAESDAILEKANKWLGRAVILNESLERFRLVLLLGEPRQKHLEQAAHKAENILRKAPGEMLIIREREAGQLAELADRDLREHSDQIA